MNPRSFDRHQQYIVNSRSFLAPNSLYSGVESSDHAYLPPRMPTQHITRARVCPLTPSLLTSRTMLWFQALHAPFLLLSNPCNPCGRLSSSISDARDPQLSYPLLGIVGARTGFRERGKGSIRVHAFTLLARLENETGPRPRPIEPF